MDDFTTSVEEDHQAVVIYYELTNILELIKLPLSKWVLNLIALREVWKAQGMDIRFETSVLGDSWNTKEDYRTFNKNQIINYLYKKHGTKRNVMRGIAKFYDPLGLLSPVLTLAKINHVSRHLASRTRLG